MVDVDNGAVIEFISDEIEKLQHKSPSTWLKVHHELVLYVRKQED